MGIKVIKPGLLTTVQDLGRQRFQKFGVPVSGGMDSIAFRLANLLVGNDENTSALEVTLIGPVLKFKHSCLIAICGADLNAMINGYEVPMWRPLMVKKNDVLRFGNASEGCRAYLAICGGLMIESVMESDSTYLRGGFGGINGRALITGDQLMVDTPSKIQSDSFVASWSISVEQLITYSSNPKIRLMIGPQYHLFSIESQRVLFSNMFQVSTNSDRMGYRLQGSKINMNDPIEMLSNPVCDGAIQVPPNGEPIVLLSDRQTTGGYPIIGYVASVDLPLLAQLKPGDRLSFTNISLEHAQKLWLEKEKKISKLKKVVIDLLSR